MQIVENKAIVFRTRNPHKYSVIPKHHVTPVNGGYEVAVYWGLDEMRVLKNLGVKSAPSPIERSYDWPGRYVPMAHQKVTAGFLTLHRRAFVFNEPGTSKTISALWAADYLMQRGEVRRVLVICPLSIMQSAWMGDINNSVVHRSAIVAHHVQASRRIEMIQGAYEIVIINYDGINLVADEINANGKFDLIIVDECFVAGTQIATPERQRPIEALQEGDEVLTTTGVKRIKRVVRNTSANLVTVRTSDGKETTCTADHPFFTDAGWVTAKNLVGRRLVRANELPDVSGGIPAEQSAGGMVPCKGYARRDDLLTILRSEAMACNESGGELLQQPSCGTAGQGAIRYSAFSGTESAHLCDDEGQGAQAASAGREWSRDDALGEPCSTFAAGTVGMELPGSVGSAARGLSYKLQARLRASNAQGGAGGGWALPQYVGKEVAGQEEGSETSGTWVESVSHHEQGSAVPVYNLEVEGTPHYFANGNLVHNCNAYATVTTRRWKALAKIVKPHTFLWMMTGTPAAQSPLHAYGLARLVNPTAVPNYFTAWRDKVMHKITTFKWAPKPGSREQVYDALQPAIRFTKAQCLDLPPVIKQTREVDLTPQQAKYYKLIKEQMLAMAAGETISAVNKAAVVSKLLQISAGAAYTEQKEIVEFDATPRMNLLLEILEETERKVIIFALFRSSISMISAFLAKHGIASEEIHGDVPASKRGDIINRFQHQPSPRVLVMQPQATAHGITLTAADTVVFFGPLMSVEQYVQCIARSDRKGQTADKVTVVHIQSSPIEKKMFDAMDTKVDDHALLSQMFEAEIAT